MKVLWAFLLGAPLFADAIVPGRYIVELDTEPLAAHAVRLAGHGQAARTALSGSGVAAHRARLRAGQESVQLAIEAGQGRVLERVETVANALIVSMPDEEAARIAQLPGVRAVHPVRTFHLLLDHALPLHKVVGAWTQVGMGAAGAGAKIAIIDTGVDIGHPGLQDPSLSVPQGYPKTRAVADVAYTNGKVIAARAYPSLYIRSDPDSTPRDHWGHGTATAMIAAGAINFGPLTYIAGVAPRAWVGSYKVFGTPGVNDSATDDAILQAIDDAVKDGMDVINLSLGTDLASLPENDPEVRALDNAASLGVIVVVAAGNNGPDPTTISSPATAASVISVGATANDRVFAGTAAVTGAAPYTAIPGNGPTPPNQAITAPLKDVATLDGNGRLCDLLPAGSLRGTIALILRGVCTFQVKLVNAQAAGAVAALVYSKPEDPDALAMDVLGALLPAELVSYQDGLDIKKRLTAATQATLQFNLTARPMDANSLGKFFAHGPSVDFSIKPDLVAVGANLYTAAQSFDRRGPLYSADGYSVEFGTSFSAPLVAGAAALVKAARPGLTAAQYRSLLVNSAAPAFSSPGQPASIQQAGAGRLDVLAALNATATAAPVSLSFGVGGRDVNLSRNLTITNAGKAADTFQLRVDPWNGVAVPRLASSSVRLNPGQSASIAVSLAGGSLPPGQYQGFVTVQGTAAGVVTRVPYWYGISSGNARVIALLFSADIGRAGATLSDAALFRITDEFGIALTDQVPVITASGDSQVTLFRASRDRLSPNAYSFNVKLATRPGPNVFHIQVGGAARDITIQGQ